jgi:hypothetical protein
MPALAAGDGGRPANSAAGSGLVVAFVKIRSSSVDVNFSVRVLTNPLYESEQQPAKISF